MSCDIEPAAPDGPLYRIGRAPDPWAWPDWSRANPDGTFGNRYDDPAGEYRVVYASSERLGALVEVLARFRPDPAVLAGLAEVEREEGEQDAAPAGVVTRRWLDERRIGIGQSGGPFALAAHSRSLAHLRTELADRVVHHGLDDLDAGTIRLHAPRRFTQEVSRHVYECADDSGEAQFKGIAYRSRLGDDFHNWALFERADAERPDVEELDVEEIDPGDDELDVALGMLGVTLV